MVSDSIRDPAWAAGFVLPPDRSGTLPCSRDRNAPFGPRYAITARRHSAAAGPVMAVLSLGGQSWTSRPARYASSPPGLTGLWRLGLGLVAGIAPARSEPDPVTIHYGGGAVRYEHAYLSDPEDPRTVDWLRRQRSYHDAVIDHLPIDVPALQADMSAAQPGVAPPSQLQETGGALFYIDACKLWRREASGDAAIVFDPTGLEPPCQGIMAFEVSPDGRRAWIGCSRDHREYLRVLDLASGQVSEEMCLRRMSMGRPKWIDADHLAIGSPAPSHELPLTQRWLDQRLSLHRIEGEPPAIGPGRAMFDRDLHGLPPESKLTAGVAGDYATVTVGIGNDSFDRHVFVKPVASLWDGPDGWQPILPGHPVSSVVSAGNRLFVASYRDAPYGTVHQVDLDGPNGVRSHTVLEAVGGMILDDFTKPLCCDSEGLYVKRLTIDPEDGHRDRLWFVPFEGEPREVGLPMAGRLSEMTADPDRPGLHFFSASLTGASGHYHYDPVADRLEPSDLTAPVGDVPGLEAAVYQASGADGNPALYTVVRPSGDGPLPAVVEVYGAYGTALAPFPRALLQMAARHRFALVQAHVRGGPEKGRDWHLAGRQANRYRGTQDLCAIAANLVDRGIAWPGRVGAHGFSAAGLHLALAAIRHPEAFCAVVIRGGVVDATRKEDCANGRLEPPEFGTRETAEGLQALLDGNPYHEALQAAQAGQRVTPMYLLGGEADVNVLAGPLRELAEVLQHADRGPASPRWGAPLVVYGERDGAHAGLAELDAAGLAFLLAHSHMP